MIGRTTAFRLIRPLDVLLTILACFCAAVVVTLISIDVFARYVLGSSLVFAAEVARLMFVWMIFLGLPLALVRGRHVSINIGDTLLPVFAALWLRRVAMALSIGLLLIVSWKCWDVMLFNWSQRMMTVPLSGGLFYLPALIGALASAYFLMIGLLVGDFTLIQEDED